MSSVLDEEEIDEDEKMIPLQLPMIPPPSSATIPPLINRTDRGRLPSAKPQVNGHKQDAFKIGQSQTPERESQEFNFFDDGAKIELNISNGRGNQSKTKQTIECTSIVVAEASILRVFS